MVVGYAAVLCAGYARPLVETLRERTRFQNRVKRNKKSGMYTKGKSDPRQATPKGSRGQAYPREGSVEKAVGESAG